MTSHPTPIRIHVSEIEGGWERIELRCGCITLGRVIAIWESVPDEITELLALHRERAPRCQHPFVGARP